MINFAAITPHPPIIVPGIGSFGNLQKAEKTVLAMKKLGQELESARPDVVVIISPHFPIHPYSFGINKKHRLFGELVGAKSNKKFEFKNDTKMAERIIYACEMNNEIPIHTFKANLNYGVLVPLHYLIRNIKPLLLPISFSALNLHTHYNFGELLGKICREERKDIAIIASGDLSHRLASDAPDGFPVRETEFDRKLIRALTLDMVSNILEFKEDFIEGARECGLRSITMLLGALKGMKYEFKEYSYEYPFGVGYLTARLY